MDININTVFTAVQTQQTAVRQSAGKYSLPLPLLLLIIIIGINGIEFEVFILLLPSYFRKECAKIVDIVNTYYIIIISIRVEYII